MRKTLVAQFLGVVTFVLLIGTAWATPITIIGENFKGTTLGGGFGAQPPDTMGAVGPNHFVELLNGAFSIYNKDGSLAQLRQTQNSFWTNIAGVPTSNSFDPRILFDTNTGRWFTVAVDNSFNANSSILVARSDTSNPTGSWQGVRIDADNSDTRWADFPTVGISKDGLYIATAMFPLTSGSDLTSLYAIPMADLLKPSPSVANMSFFGNKSHNDIGLLLQPVVNLDGGGQPEIMLSSFFFSRTDVTGPLNAANSASLSNRTFITVPPFSGPPLAQQLGPNDDIYTGDNRFSSSVLLQNGDLWGVMSVDNGGRSAIRWFRINPVSNKLLESGVISDPNLAFYFGSIAVNDFGEIVIGFSGSDNNSFISTYYVAGETIAGVTSFDTPHLIQAGLGNFDDNVINNNLTRWGDYSATTLDPTDPTHFWTIQQFADTSNRWSTQITEIIFGQPTPIPEPSTWLLLSTGLIGLLGYGLRQRIQGLRAE